MTDSCAINLEVKNSNAEFKDCSATSAECSPISPNCSPTSDDSGLPESQKAKAKKKNWTPPNWLLATVIVLFTIIIMIIVSISLAKIQKLSIQFNGFIDLEKPLNKSKILPSNCVEAAGKTRTSSVYDIQVPGYDAGPFAVACSEQYYFGGWTVILRRVDGSVDFYRDWLDYKQGFGNVHNEFWLGLDKLHALTNGKNQELLIVLHIAGGESREARYEHFAIANETAGYALIELGTYSGDAGDALSYHLGQKFTTKDRKNNPAPENCAVKHGGAWWFKYCRKSNLNGRYDVQEAEKSIEWTTFSSNLKFAEMMIRPLRQMAHPPPPPPLPAN